MTPTRTDQGDVIAYWPGRETTQWRDGKIVEEYLKYDNASFMRHIGLAQRDIATCGPFGGRASLAGPGPTS